VATGCKGADADLAQADVAAPVVRIWVASAFEEDLSGQHVRRHVPCVRGVGHVRGQMDRVRAAEV
jgi:hypothetical protein